MLHLSIQFKHGEGGKCVPALGRSHPFEDFLLLFGGGRSWIVFKEVMLVECMLRRLNVNKLKKTLPG